MSTYLMRFSAPMQSWGIQSRFVYRDAGREPSKSGVVGLIAAAMGRQRTESVADLLALTLGVRVNAEGTILQDYHTVGGTARGTKGYGVRQFNEEGTTTVLSHRSYLADADFLVGLEATSPVQEDLLDRVDAALAAPVWPLFLGRKAFVPSRPIRLPVAPPLGPGRRNLPLRDALLTFPWPRPPRQNAKERPDPAAIQRLRFVLESPDDTSGEQRMDRTVGYTRNQWTYLPRYVRVELIERPAQIQDLHEVDL